MVLGIVAIPEIRVEVAEGRTAILVDQLQTFSAELGREGVKEAKYRALVVSTRPDRRNMNWRSTADEQDRDE